MPRLSSQARRVSAAFVALWGSAAAAAAGSVEHRWELAAEMTWTQPRDSLLNPGASLVDLDEARGLGRAHADLGARAWGDRLRLKTQLAAEHRRGDEASSRLAVREAYAHLSLGPFDVSAGRKILKWSEGYAFNPAGLLDPPRDPADPQDRLGALEGRDLVQVDFYRGAHTLTAAVASEGLFGAESWNGGSLVALRYELEVRGLRAAAAGALRPRGRDSAALALNWGVGDRVAIHAELVGARGSDALLPRSALPGHERTLLAPDFLGPIRAGDKSLYLRWLVGINVTGPAGINAIAEYYHADDGLDASEWSRFLAQAQYARNLFDRAGAIAGADLQLASSTLGRTQARRDYLFLRVAPPSFLAGKVEGAVIGLMNVSDHSLALVPDVSVRVGRNVRVYLRGTGLLGGPASEYGNVPVGRVLDVGLRFFP